MAFGLKQWNNLSGRPWSFLNCVQKIAISCMHEHDSNDMHIRWPKDQGIQSLYCIDQHSGIETQILLQMVRDFEPELQTMAEALLEDIGSECLSSAQVARVRDGSREVAGLNLF
jgi:hypothetical protein